MARFGVPSGGAPTKKLRVSSPVASVQSALHTVQKTIDTFATAKNAVAGPPGGYPAKKVWGLGAFAALLTPIAALATPIFSRLYTDSREDRKARREKRFSPLTVGDSPKIKRSLVDSGGQVSSATCEKIGDGPTARCTFVRAGKTESRDVNLDDCTATTCKI